MRRKSRREKTKNLWNWGAFAVRSCCRWHQSMMDQWSLVNYKIDHQRESVKALNFIVTQPTNALTLRCDSKKTLLRDCGKFMWQFHSSRDAHKRSQEGIFCALWVVHFMVGFGWVRGSDLAPEEKRRRRNFLDCIQLPFHGGKLRDSSWSSGSHSLLSLRWNVGSQTGFARGFSFAVLRAKF